LRGRCVLAASSRAVLLQFKILLNNSSECFFIKENILYEALDVGEAAHHKMFALHKVTSSSAVAQRPRDGLCLSVVSLNKIITRAESFMLVTEATDLSLHNVVFGVTLRLLVIHFVVVSRHQQTRPLTSD